MRFNAKKCYILSIRHESSRFYQLDGEILQEVNSSPYLGITISNDLQWKTHITKIVKKSKFYTWIPSSKPKILPRGM